jgi:nucleotide-binding universal stress UspA family protein
MFDTVVIATDGSETAARAVSVALDFAARFDATVHALYVVEQRDLEGSPDAVRAELAAALEEAAEDALSAVREHADRSVETAVREGKPHAEIIRYADDVDADVVAAGTRGRHGEHAFLLGSVAEGLVRHCDRPVLTVRQLAAEETDAELSA